MKWAERYAALVRGDVTRARDELLPPEMPPEIELQARWFAVDYIDRT